MEKYFLLIFKNTQGALKAESFLKEKGIKLVIMPTPTHITQSCGISIRLSDEEFNKTKPFVSDGSVEYKYIYVREAGQFTEVTL